MSMLRRRGEDMDELDASVVRTATTFIYQMKGLQAERQVPALTYQALRDAVLRREDALDRHKRELTRLKACIDRNLETQRRELYKRNGIPEDGVLT